MLTNRVAFHLVNLLLPELLFYLRGGLVSEHHHLLKILSLIGNVQIFSLLFPKLKQFNILR